MNLTELHQNASFLDWTRYFNSAFESVGRKIDSGLEVVNYAPVYLRDEQLWILLRDSRFVPPCCPRAYTNFIGS